MDLCLEVTYPNLPETIFLTQFLSALKDCFANLNKFLHGLATLRVLQWRLA